MRYVSKQGDNILVGKLKKKKDHLILSANIIGYSLREAREDTG